VKLGDIGAWYERRSEAGTISESWVVDLGMRGVLKLGAVLKLGGSGARGDGGP